MKLRTFDELNAALDAELTWRKRELSDLRYFVDLAVTEQSKRMVLARCGVTILYAHWEGFVKLAARYFLEYVAMQRPRNRELRPCLLTLSMYSSVKPQPNTTRMSEFGKLTSFFVSNMEGRASIGFRAAIDTESNLSSKVLKEILWCLGVDYAPYETKEKFIDSRLLGRRNHIAHGESTDVDPDEYVEMRDIVIELMVTLKNQIENSAVMKDYLLPSGPAAEV